MGSNLVRDTLMAAAIITAGALAFVNREAIYEIVGVHPADVIEAKNQRENSDQIAIVNEPENPPLSGSAASIRKATDGQFWTEARVNSTTVKFLVDTGASVVALTPADALKAGFQPRDLVYNAPVNTAAGQIMAASIELDIIKVGGVMVRDVRGIVIPDGLSHSLLGMSFLGELQKVEATKSALILRQ
ncbi:MAG: TIGR02281 family clan AA aspartic protease [Hyphomonadaceae bacterium]|nr:TIGR02281 family clan AA aspartic protease [Hyphomonadaceae bacterium]